jgi:hypothetical protein
MAAPWPERATPRRLLRLTSNPSYGTRREQYCEDDRACSPVYVTGKTSAVTPSFER